MTKAASQIGEYLASHGAPFYDLQLRIGLLRRDSLCVSRRALILVAMTWGVPLVLSAVAGRALGPADRSPFLLDMIAWARFFVAVGAFVLAEQMTEDAHRATLRQFERAPVIAPSSIDDAVNAVLRACRGRDSRTAEAVCLLLALLISVASYSRLTSVPGSSWAVEASPGEHNRLTLAAWWCLMVSGPIFWFLLLRTVWRGFVWSELLRRLAGLELRLVATHPDGNGGLGFVGQVPNAYTLFVFAVSCVVGAALARHGLDQQLTTTTATAVMAGWLLVVFGLLCFPLTAFSNPLARLKKETLAATGAQATQFHREWERKTLGHNIAAGETAEEQVDVADPSKQFETTGKLSIWLFKRSTLVPVAVAALLPLAAVAATQLPYKDVAIILKKLLLL
ncbi:hypothetical protein RFN29_27600 [Mesorhizobium sp. VK22B]|uniref:Transmembrane protein n=1 Tax=Mesorhizobium captivum TaxID=3072319 RepID=A0ABU4Z7T5_9HYPH|nr:hypothetical protein [Mesorhizobium sp. VK22B]MDX8495328.1 hypothetical protein [Mesorhizobium sp. VK22B]